MVICFGTNSFNFLKSTNTDLAALLQNYKVQHLGQLNETQYLDIKTKIGGVK